MARRRGDGVPFVRTTIAMDARDLEQIRKIAHEQRIPPTTWIRDALLLAVAAHKADKKERRTTARAS